MGLLRQAIQLQPNFDGVMQRQDGVHSVLASHIEALTGVHRPTQRSAHMTTGETIVGTNHG